MFSTMFIAEDDFLLTFIINCKKKTERIIIGSEVNVLNYLRTGDANNIFFDKTSPLGTTVKNHYIKSRGEWADITGSLVFALEHHNQEAEEQAMKQLAEKIKSYDGIDKYVCLKLFNEYAKAKLADTHESIDKFDYIANELTYTYRYVGDIDYHLSDLPAGCFNKRPRNSSITKIESDIWFPSNRYDLECISVNISFIPLFHFIAHRINAMGLTFSMCKNCQEVFIADNQKFKFCCEECRKESTAKNKIKYRENMNEYQREYSKHQKSWNHLLHSNRIEKLTTENKEKLKSYIQLLTRRAKTECKIQAKQQCNINNFKNFLFALDKQIEDKYISLL